MINNAQRDRLLAAGGGLRKLYNQVKDEAVRELALSLIASEADPEYQKKYAAIWRVR